MLNAKKMKKACLVTVSIVAILAAMVFGFASCSEPTATGLTYKGNLQKGTYELNEMFDPAGAIMELTYSDGSKVDVSFKDLIVGSVPLVTEGKVEVTVTYNLNGTLIEGKIPVTVKNTLGEAKAAQKAAAAELVKDLTLDANTQMLYDLCVAVIGNATTAADAEAAVARLQAQLTAYNAGVTADSALAAAKAAQVAAAKAYVAADKMNEDLQMYLDLCIANIANAVTADEATAAVAAYKAKADAYKAIADADAALAAAKADKKAAIAALIAADAALAEDMGALELQAGYYAYIDYAETIDEVNEIAAGFEADLANYVAVSAAKEEALQTIADLVATLPGAGYATGVTVTANPALVQSELEYYVAMLAYADSVEAVEDLVADFEIFVTEYNDALTVAQDTIDNLDYSTMPTICQQMMESYLQSLVASIATAWAPSDIINYVNAYEAQYYAVEVIAENHVEDGALVEAFAQMTADIRAQRDEILADPWYSDEAKVEVMLAADYAIDKILMILGTMDENGKTNADEVVDAFEGLIEDTDTLIDDIYQAYLALGCPHGAATCPECAKSSTPDANNNIHYTDECYDMIDDLAILVAQAYAIDAVKATEALENYSRRTPNNEVVDLIAGPVEGVNAALEGINNKAFDYVTYVTTGVIEGGRHDTLGEAAYAAQIEKVYDSNGDSVLDMSIVEMIDAIGTVTVDSLPAIKAAYAAYVDWAEAYDIIDMTTATADATYGVDLYTAVDGNDQSVLVPNYDDLWAAWDEYLAIMDALAEDLDELYAAIDAIGKVMIGVVPTYDADGNLTNEDVAEFRADGTAVDSNALILAAEALKAALEAEATYNVSGHVADYYVVNGKDYAKILADARTAYTDLQGKVTNLNYLIGRLLVDGNEVVLGDKAALDTIKAADDAFAAINVENGKVFRGLIPYYYHYEDIYEQWSVLQTEEVVKAEKKALIDAKVAALGGAVELVEIADEYKAQIDNWTSYTLPENVAQLEALAHYTAELQKIVDAAIAALEA